ncbi:Acg family FMN-binding oxidoreductase [Streptomyces sp. NRRL S-646]|uniref:Acg family FMN-binding oxidoreductase n=1 Tax=Streptomyces sp. NRRL S-646 TaxID=1463917 RepID=UPI0004C50A1F|nr:nitroreductase [Streptomyces sp. NRRL S-646]
MPAQPLDTMNVTALVAAATAAPSLHNAQPWRFRHHRADAILEVRADFERAMPHTDPDNRALHLGCGAALFNLRIAAAEHGLHTDTRLLPDPADGELLAVVQLDDSHRPDRDLATLFPAIARRHTSRHPFQDKPIPVAVQDALSDAALQEGAELVFPDAWHVESLLEHVRDVEGRDSLHPEGFEDVERWTRIGAESAGTAVDGILERAFGPSKQPGRAPVRDFAGRHPVPGRPTAVFETTPHLALLGTRNDRPDDWLRAGQALERVLLLATLDGLATSLTSHALERADLRELARDPRSAMGFVHMVLRLGYGPVGTGTPRRPVHEVLEID